MSNKTAISNQSGKTLFETVLLPAFAALFLLLTPMTQATPMTVKVYGTPFFTLAAGQGEYATKQEWMVLTSAQSLEIELEADEINLQGPQDLTMRDLSGGLEQFSLTRMSLSLPDANSVSGGVIDYLIGDYAGTFNVQQVVHRSPAFDAESVLSVFFWGIDYLNGVGLILGLEAAPTSNAHAATTVSEPSLLMLLLMGCGAYWLSLGSRRQRIQIKTI